MGNAEKFQSNYVKFYHNAVVVEFTFSFPRDGSTAFTPDHTTNKIEVKLGEGVSPR